MVAFMKCFMMVELASASSRMVLRTARSSSCLVKALKCTAKNIMGSTFYEIDGVVVGRFAALEEAYSTHPDAPSVSLPFPKKASKGGKILSSKSSHTSKNEKSLGDFFNDLFNLTELATFELYKDLRKKHFESTVPESALDKPNLDAALSKVFQMWLDCFESAKQTHELQRTQMREDEDTMLVMGARFPQDRNFDIEGGPDCEIKAVTPGGWAARYTDLQCCGDEMRAAVADVNFLIAGKPVTFTVSKNKAS